MKEISSTFLRNRDVARFLLQSVIFYILLKMVSLHFERIKLTNFSSTRNDYAISREIPMRRIFGNVFLFRWKYHSRRFFAQTLTSEMCF